MSKHTKHHNLMAKWETISKLFPTSPLGFAVTKTSGVVSKNICNRYPSKICISGRKNLFYHIEKGT